MEGRDCSFVGGGEGGGVRGACSRLRALRGKEIHPRTLQEANTHLVPDVQQVRKALGDHQRHPFSFPFQQRVGRHCGAHPDGGNPAGGHRLRAGVRHACDLL